MNNGAEPYFGMAPLQVLTSVKEGVRLELTNLKAEFAQLVSVSLQILSYTVEMRLDWNIARSLPDKDMKDVGGLPFNRAIV